MLVLCVDIGSSVGLLILEDRGPIPILDNISAVATLATSDTIVC